jgi:hypothetical protein
MVYGTVENWKWIVADRAGLALVIMGSLMKGKIVLIAGGIVSLARK